MAFDRVEPDGAVRDDYRAGVLWAAIANTMGRSKGKPPYRWTDVFPEHESARSQEGEDHAAALTIFAHAKMLGSMGAAPSKAAPKGQRG